MVRQYFDQTGALEVTTPTLRVAGVSDVHLENLTVSLNGGKGYLQTSPEYAMKVLLANYQRDLYQICPAFRGGEAGAKHRVEFQMLEWYRCGMKLPALMADLASLFRALVAGLADDFDLAHEQDDLQRVSYRTLFEAKFHLNPHSASLLQLRQLTDHLDLKHLDQSANVSDCLDALFSTSIEPALRQPTLVYDYPAVQCALADVSSGEQGDLVSQRFEFFAGGLELANAYQELTDAEELQRRLEENNRQRDKLGRPRVPLDEALIEATGRLPACAGIAMGIDRLAMVLLGADSIDAVTP